MATRLVAAILGLVILACLVNAIVAGTGDIGIYFTLGAGLIIAGVFAFLGSVPSWLFTVLGMGVPMELDDENESNLQNISPKVYLPIVIVLLVSGAVLIYLVSR